MKKLALILLAASAVIALGACSNGLSTQDAYVACKQLGEADQTSSEFLACVACFENCDDCVPRGTTPETFACPNDDTTTSSSGASSSSGM